MRTTTTTTTRAELLFLSQQAPWPEDSGGNQRSAAILRGLAEGFEVTLVACEPPAGRRAEAERALAASAAHVHFVPDSKRRDALGLGRTLLRSVLHGRPLLIEHNASPALVRRWWGGLGRVGRRGPAGNMAWEFDDRETGTTLTWRYAVGGYLSRAQGLDEVAPAVDGVLLEQMNALRRFVEKGALEE